MKILFVATISNTVNAFLIPHIKMLIEQGHHVDVAFNIEQEVNPEISELGCKVHVLDFKRSPLNINNYIAYKKLKKIIQNEDYNLVHTHTPVASVIVRIACRNINNVKVFYTAHGFHFFKGSPIKNWLIFFPIEKWLSKYTDVIITINKEDYKRARKSFKAKQVEYIPGIGINVKYFSENVIDKYEKRKELNLPEDAFIVLSVGELNKNKNHEAIIRAIRRLNDGNVYYLICGQGPIKKYLYNLIIKLRLESQVKLLGFRTDIAEICKAADVFAFPSKREGLGLAALEAMACGLPIVTSNVHGIVDYSVNGETGYTSNPTDIDGFAKAIKELEVNLESRKIMSKNNINAVKNFDLSNVINILQSLYKNN